MIGVPPCVCVSVCVCVGIVMLSFNTLSYGRHAQLLKDRDSKSDGLTARHLLNYMAIIVA